MSGLTGRWGPTATDDTRRLDARCLTTPVGGLDGPSYGTRATGAPGFALARRGRQAAVVAGEALGLQAWRRALHLGRATPADVVLAAWRRWPQDFVDRLDGSFAFALDTGTELLLYRDPSGLQPLYWARDGTQAVVFATRLDGLAQAADGSLRPTARRSLHEYLRFLDVAAPNTWLEGASALEPGQLLRCTAGGDITPVGRAAHAPAHPAPADLACAVETLDGLLRRSVRRRLAGATRPAAFLSGGVDSGLLCALAHRQRPDTVALSVAFDGAEFDESPQAVRIATHLGMEHRILRFGRSDHLRAFDRLCTTLDQPMADPATLATVLAFEHGRERFDVILDGTGADEAIGVMPPRHVRLAVQYASLLPRATRTALVHALRALPPLADYAPILEFEHPADTMIRWHGFTRSEVEALCGEPVSFGHTTFYRTFARFPRHAHLERSTALLNAMPCDRLVAATAATGAQVRYPYFDHRVFRFLEQLAPEIRHAPDEPKRVLREAFARHVPRGIWDQPKHGFNFPLAGFLAGDDFALVRHHLLDSDVWRSTQLLAPEQVRRHALEFIAGERQLAFRVWALVLLAGWLVARTTRTRQGG